MQNSNIRSDKKTLFGIKSNPVVSLWSIFIIILLISVTIIAGPEKMSEIINNIQKNISWNFWWILVWAMNILLFFALYLGFWKFKNMKLGWPEAKTDFSTAWWFAMLFSAWIWSWLLFWSVAEPVQHFLANPFVNNSANPETAAQTAMTLSFLHWGLHGWALFAIVALALAYFSFNKWLPLTIRSLFYPLLGKKIYWPIWDIIDIVAVTWTIFWLATSLWLWADQMWAWIEYVFWLDNSVILQIALIAWITWLATLSLILWLDKWIRKLSEINMKIAFTLMMFLIILWPTMFLLKWFIQNVGVYLADFIALGSWANTYGWAESKTWQSANTIFYWAWWISWSPFVGLFIARISRWRTFQEFILWVMLVPSIVVFLWFSVFGWSALFQELAWNNIVSQAVANGQVSTAIYRMLEQYPFAIISSLITIVLVASFFVTSSDSWSFVVDTLTSGWRYDSPKWQKIFWASMQWIVASVLLIAWWLDALQTVTVLTWIPFWIILIVMCYSFYKSLEQDNKSVAKKVVDKIKND